MAMQTHQLCFPSSLYISIMYSCLGFTSGYGNVYPATTAGQVLTVFYAILGIPLVLTALNELGKFLFLLILDLYIILSNKSKCSKSANAPSKSEVGKTGDPVIEITTHHFVQDEMIEIDPLDEELLEEKVKSIPVWVALTVTIGWIFLCAGIFLIFEHDWTFWESTYFIFISLSTIGLGDLTPSNPAYMVAVMLLVIVGLSLVSMSIGVIQNRLEELYIQLLMMILTEYQKRISQGLGESDATVGMMDTWANNKTAKFLLPLLR